MDRERENIIYNELCRKAAKKSRLGISEVKIIIEKIYFGEGNEGMRSISQYKDIVRAGIIGSIVKRTDYRARRRRGKRFSIRMFDKLIKRNR